MTTRITVHVVETATAADDFFDRYEKLLNLLVQPGILKPRIVGGSGKNAGKLETGQMLAKRLSRLMTMARKRHLVSYESLTDGVRDDLKPSSWAGILDYTDTGNQRYLSNN